MDLMELLSTSICVLDLVDLKVIKSRKQFMVPSIIPKMKLTILSIIFEVHFFVFREIFSKILSLCMVNIQERVMMAHMVFKIQIDTLLLFNTPIFTAPDILGVFGTMTICLFCLFLPQPLVYGFPYYSFTNE